MTTETREEKLTFIGESYIGEMFEKRIKDRFNTDDLKFETVKSWSYGDDDLKEQTDIFGFVSYFRMPTSEEEGATVQFPIILSVRSAEHFTPERFDEIFDGMENASKVWLKKILPYTAEDDMDFLFFYIEEDGSLRYAFEKFNEDCP